MKIAAIEVRLLIDQLRTPIVSRAASGNELCVITCTIHTDEGVTGRGYGWALGAERGAAICSAVETIAPIALGSDPLRIEQIWDMYWSFSTFVGHSGLSMIGMSVIDIGLWDLRCQYHQMPLWLALGGHKDSARVYSAALAATFVGGETAIEAIAEEARSLVDQGHRLLKLFLADPGAVRSVGEVMQMVPGPEWAVDCVQGWDARTTVRLGSALDDLGLQWIEDPAQYDDYDGIAHVARSIRTPVCTGENLYYLNEQLRLLRETPVRLIQVDLQRSGGITGWQKIAAIAEAHNAMVIPHSYTPIGIQLSCGTRNSPFVEDVPFYDRMIGPELRVADGMAQPRTEPGVGIEFVPDAFRSAAKISRIEQ